MNEKILTFDELLAEEKDFACLELMHANNRFMAACNIINKPSQRLKGMAFFSSLVNSDKEFTKEIANLYEAHTDITAASCAFFLLACAYRDKERPGKFLFTIDLHRYVKRAVEGSLLFQAEPWRDSIQAVLKEMDKESLATFEGALDIFRNKLEDTIFESTMAAERAQKMPFPAWVAKEYPKPG